MTNSPDLPRELRKAYMLFPLTSPDYVTRDSMERYYQQRKIKALTWVMSSLLLKASEKDEVPFLLDLGAGEGIALDLAHNLIPDIFAVSLEISGAYCEALKKKGYNPIRADVGAVPVRSGAVDVLTFLDVIEHFMSPDRVLSEIHRLLRTEAVCIITTPNRFGVYEYKELVYVGPFRHMRDVLNSIRGKPRRYFPYHVKLYSLRDLMRLLRLYGLPVKRAFSVGFCFPFLGTVVWAGRLLSIDIFRSSLLKLVLDSFERHFAVINFLIVAVCAKKS